MTSLSPARRDLVEHISAQSGSLPCSNRLAPYLLYSAALPGTSVPPPPAQNVHLSILPREPKLPSFGAMHACHGDRTLAGLAVIDGDDAPAVDAPRHLVLILASRDAGIAFDAAISVAEKFHPCHG